MGPSTRRLCLLAGSFAITLAHCSSPPTPPTEDAFDWHVVIDELPEAMLSVCGINGELIAVGGDGRGLVIEQQTSEWQASTINSAVLWWCWADPNGERIVAVGERGSIVERTDNGGWKSIVHDVVSPEMTLFGVWGSGANDVYAVGGNPALPRSGSVIVHYDGETWSSVDVSAVSEYTLFKVWGSSADDVWAVGEGGTLLHFDGMSWSREPSPTDDTLIAVYGTSPTEVFAVGGRSHGLVLHYDGDSWTTFASPPSPLSGVWIAPGSPLYVGGGRGLLGRYARQDGAVRASTLTAVAPVPTTDVHALFGIGDGANLTVAAVGSDLVAGDSGSWRGALLAHPTNLSGQLYRGPDATMIDATPIDASPPDSSVDANPSDADLADAGPKAGPGEQCFSPEDCQEGLECWYLQKTNDAICTIQCSDPSECTDYGPDACCETPGTQVFFIDVCIPAGYEECTDPF